MRDVQGFGKRKSTVGMPRPKKAKPLPLETSGMPTVVEMRDECAAAKLPRGNPERGTQGRSLWLGMTRVCLAMADLPRLRSPFFRLRAAFSPARDPTGRSIR